MYPLEGKLGRWDDRCSIVYSFISQRRREKDRLYRYRIQRPPTEQRLRRGHELVVTVTATGETEVQGKDAREKICANKQNGSPSVQVLGFPLQSLSLSLSLSGVQAVGRTGSPSYTVNGLPHSQVLGFPLE